MNRNVRAYCLGRIAQERTAPRCDDQGSCCLYIPLLRDKLTSPNGNGRTLATVPLRRDEKHTRRGLRLRGSMGGGNGSGTALRYGRSPLPGLPPGHERGSLRSGNAAALATEVTSGFPGLEFEWDQILYFEEPRNLQRVSFFRLRRCRVPEFSVRHEPHEWRSGEDIGCPPLVHRPRAGL